MNEINSPIQSSLKAVVNYLNCRFRQNSEEEMYKAIIAEYIAVLAKNICRIEKPVSYVEQVKKLRGEYKEDNRTAKEIIKDTFDMFGIEVVEE